MHIIQSRLVIPIAMSPTPPDSAPPTVFDPQFRRSLAERDEPATAAGAEWAGPWRVELLDGRWLWAEVCAELLLSLGPAGLEQVGQILALRVASGDLP